MAWVAYAIVSKDVYVFLANDPGLLLGLFYTLSAFGYADAKVVFHLPAYSLSCLQLFVCCNQNSNFPTADCVCHWSK